MKAIENMTVKELKQYIRSATIEANERISTYSYEYIQSNAGTVGDLITGLKSSGTGNTSRDYVGLGFTGKNKADLLEQAQGLEYFNQWDYMSQKASRERREQEDKAWETFQRHHKKWDRDQWANAMNFFNNISDSVIGQFGSEEVIEMFSYADDNDISPEAFSDIIKETTEEATGQGWTSEDLVDALWERINNYDSL